MADKSGPGEKVPLVGFPPTTTSTLDVKRSQWYHTTFVIMAEVMGAGVLGLPYATSRLGLVLGSTVSLVFGVAATYSGLLLARARHDGLHEANSYSDLAQALGGPLAGRLTAGVVLVAWGSLLPYFLLACADSINLALAPDWQLPLWQNARLVVFLLLLPLQLRTLHNLSYLAVPSTIAIVVAILIVLATLPAAAAPADETQPAWSGAPVEASLAQVPPSLNQVVPSLEAIPTDVDGLAVANVAAAASNGILRYLSDSMGTSPAASWGPTDAASEGGASAVGGNPPPNLGEGQGVRGGRAQRLGGSIAWPMADVTFMDATGHVCAFVFAYMGHSQYLEMMREMQDSREFATRALPVANAVMIVVFTATAVATVCMLGRNVADFLPNSMPPGPARRITGVLLTFHTLVSYLVTGQPLHRAYHGLLFPETVDDFVSSRASAHWFLITSAQLFMSFGLAVAIPFFANFQGLIGALTGAVSIFLLPAVFFLKGSSRSATPVRKLDVAFCSVYILVLTPLFLFVGTYNEVTTILSKWELSLKHALPQ